MAKRIELPQTPQGSEEEQLRAMYSYLYQMAMTLNNNLAEIGGSELTDDEMKVMRDVLDGGEKVAAGTDSNHSWQETDTLKSMIIKTARFVRTAIDEYNMKLIGTVEAEGMLGRYVRNTGMDVAVNPEGITQRFSFQEIIQGLKTFEINSKNYIKSGLLRTAQGLPVYGVAIGKDIVTFSEEGEETYHDGNKVAELTADELSFWQDGAKIASYTGSRISFLYAGDEVFYIQNGIIYFSGNMQINAGKMLEIVGTAGIHIATNGKLVIDSGQLRIDRSGNATFSGNLSAAGGTFAGNLSAAGGTFAGTMSAACIISGTMSADRISGGTLQVGGSNNTHGRLVIKDENGVDIGWWDKDGIHAEKGYFEGTLKAGGWDFTSQGAQYTHNNLYTMGIGYDARANFNNGGLYFKSNGSGGSQIKLQSKDSTGRYEANVIIECSGDGESTNTYGGSFYQTGTRGTATIYLGTSTFPWYNSYLRNIIGQEMIRIYPTYTDSAFVMFSYVSTLGWLEVAPFGFSNQANLGQPSAKWSHLYVQDVNYSGALVQESSREIKHDIQKMPSMGERLDRLNPVTFIYDNDPEEKKRYGMIYEETEEVMPELCSGNEGQKGINYMELVPMLLKEIQELRARVKALEERR